MRRFVVISGCSGGGKSAVVAELQQRGHAVVVEPGRRIIAEELAKSGQALPWVNPRAFAERAIEVSLNDRKRAKEMSGLVFFDRGLIDAAAALEHVTGKPVLKQFEAERYHPRVFLTPPWPEIFANDDDRRHDWQAAVEEYDRLIKAFSSLGYVTEILPKRNVRARADLILERLQSD